MRPLIFTLSKYVLALFFLLLVQAVAGQVREDIFGDDHIATLEEHIRKNEMLQQTQDALLQVKLKAVKSNDYVLLGRSLYDLMQIRDLRTEDTLYFRNSAFMDTILNERGAPAALKAIMYVLHARRLSHFDGRYLKFNNAAYRAKNLAVDYAALSRAQRDSIEKRDLEVALTAYDFGKSAPGLLWLSSNPDVFLFSPNFADIVYAEGVYQAATKNDSMGTSGYLKKQWPALSSGAFRHVLDSMAATSGRQAEMMGTYRAWMLFHKGEPDIQLFIESLARKYVYLSGAQDSTSKSAYMGYLAENTNSPYPEFKAHVIYQLCLLWNEDGNRYADFNYRYDDFANSRFDKRYQYLPAKALELYLQNQQLMDKFPALERVLELMKGQILKSGLRVQMDDTFLPDAEIPIKVVYKNSGNLFYRVVALNAKDAYADAKGLVMVAQLKKQALQSGAFALPLPADHNSHAVYLKLPSLPKGRYCLLFDKSEIRPDAGTAYAIAFRVSGIAAVNSGRRVYVLDRKTGLPLTGAIVGLAKNRLPVDGYSKVNGAGYVTIPGEKADSLTIAFRGDTLGYRFNVHINERSNDDVYDKDEYDNPGDFYNDKLAMNIFTDRAIYRPGQTVHYKLIFLTRDPQTGARILFTPQNINGLFANRMKTWIRENKAGITLKDPFKRTVDSAKVTVNDFGSFAGSFILPKNAATGSWHIDGTPESDNGNYGDFRVEEYKRPTIELSMEKQQKMLKPGQPFVIRLKLRSFTGAQPGNIPVTYTIKRGKSLWSIAKGANTIPYLQEKLADTTGFTDNNGILSIPVNDTALTRYHLTDDYILNTDYSLEAKATDATGETTDVSENFEISSRPVKISVNTGKVIDRAELAPFNLTTSNGFEGSIGRPVQVRLYRTGDPDAGTTLAQVDQWYYAERDWNSWFPRLAEKSPVKEERLLVLDTTINTTATGELLLPKEKLDVGFYKLTALCRDSGQIVGQSDYNFKVFDSGAGQVPERGLDYMPFNSARRGETISWFTSATHNSYTICQALYSAGNQKRKVKDVYSELTEEKGLRRWVYQIPADAAGSVLLTRISVYNNEVTRLEKRIYLSETSEAPPEIIIEKYRKVMAPGAQESITLSVKTKDDNVAAELVTTLYDASLDKLEKLQWNLPQQPYDNSWFSTDWTNSISEITAAGDDAHSLPQPLYNRFGDNNGNMATYLEGRAAGVQITDSGGLNEVVVTGYSTTNAKELGYATAAVYIRGNSLLSYKQPLVILDGVVYTGDLSKIPVQAITQGIILKGADASAIYGIAGSTGVLILSTKGPIVLPNVNEEPIIKIRKNFNETAFFFPQVHADADGFYRFTFTMPETATEWNWKILAHTRDARFTYIERKLQTRMNLMVQPNMPRFLYQGDKLKLESRISNMDTVAISGTVTCKIEDAVTGQDITALLVANANQTFNLAKKSTGAAGFLLNVPARQTNPLKIVITVAGAGASDGEEHTLPVLSTKVFTRQSLAVHFKEAQSLTVPSVKLPADAELYGIGLSIQQKPQASLINALPWLANYSYDCAEQTFNKLRAKVAAVRLMKTDTLAQRQYKKATQGVEKEPAREQLLPDELAEAAMPWLNIGDQSKKTEKQLVYLLDTINTGVGIGQHLEKLYKLQQADGGLAWFDGGRSNDYISEYVLAGFGQLKRLDWKPGSNVATRQVVFVQRLVNYCEGLLSRSKTSDYDPYNLYALSYWRDLMGNASGSGPKIDSLLADGWKNAANHTLQQQAILIINTLRYTHARSELYKKALQQLSNIRQLAIEDSENGLRWKDIADSEELGESAEETMALLAEAFEAGGNYSAINSGIIKWLLTTKQDQHWQTTKATAAAIDMLQKEKSSAIGGDKGISLDINGKPLAVSDGLLDGVPAAFVSLAQNPAVINLTQQSKNADGAVSWYYFSQAGRLDTLNKAISVKKQFYRYNKDGSLAELKTGDSLKTGEDVHVTLTIETASRLKFVHISDPRAAAFEPKENRSGYQYGDAISYYQSIKDTGAELFAESVPRGVTSISYDLVVAMGGQFACGPVHLQCMYQPSASAYSNTGEFVTK